MSLGWYYSSSVSLAKISLPNSLRPSEALWSKPKQVPTINRVLNHCPRAIEKLWGRVTPSGVQDNFYVRQGGCTYTGGHHGVTVRLSAKELADRCRVMSEDKGVEPRGKIILALHP